MYQNAPHIRKRALQTRINALHTHKRGSLAQDIQSAGQSNRCANIPHISAKKPVDVQKHLTHPQKSPIDAHKYPTYPQKTAACARHAKQRALMCVDMPSHIHKRALQTRINALHFRKRGSLVQDVHSAGHSNRCTKMPHISAKEPYRRA